MSSEAGQSRRGRGCLTGCLTVLLVLVVGFAALLYLGKTWLAGKVQEAVPALAIVKNARVSLEGVRRGSTDPKDFPAELPLPLGASTAAYRSQDAQALAVLRYDKRSAKAIERELRDGLRAKGWRAQKQARVAGGLRLRFRKGKQRCEIEILTSGAGSEVWVRWKKKTESSSASP